MDRDLNILTDEAIVTMAQKGSATAYEYLIGKYRSLAKTKSKSYYINGGDNEDVIQEGMIGIFKAIRDFNEEKDVSFRTFAELCITRQIISAIKSANRQKHQILNESVSLNAGEESSEDAPALADKISSKPDAEPEKITLMREVTEYLKANGDILFSGFENRVWEETLKGRNYKEIAEILHKKPKTVDNALQRIKKKISVFLES